MNQLPLRYRDVLTPDEQRFLLTMVVLSHYQLRALLEDRLGFDPEEVRTYKKRIMKKLQAKSWVDAIVDCAKETGWWPPRTLPKRLKSQLE